MHKLRKVLDCAPRGATTKGVLRLCRCRCRYRCRTPSSSLPARHQAAFSILSDRSEVPGARGAEAFAWTTTRKQSTASSAMRQVAASASASASASAEVGSVAFSRRLASTSASSDLRFTRGGRQSSSDLPDDLFALVQKHASELPTSSSLQTLLRTGRGELLHKTYGDETLSNKQTSVATEKVLIQVAGFLRHELPIRLAHRILELDSVPLMSGMPSVKSVRDTYVDSFLELIQEPEITNPEREDDFARRLETLYDKHSGVLVDMARGAYELRARVRSGEIRPPDGAGAEFERMADLHEFLDRFYTSRVGIRVLAGQYLSLRQPPVEGYIGMICSRTSPLECVEVAVSDAEKICTRKYGDAPDVVVSGQLDLTFPYIPTHVHYILLELIKNSMRATMEWHGGDADCYPPVRVVIADGTENEDVVIKVADEGGGIPRSNMKRIWSYLFTTADPAVQEGCLAEDTFGGGAVDHSTDSPLAGLGYGLPISRSYARYFGGDLSIMSMEGYGTDAFVYLTRLGNSREPLGI